MADNLAMSSTPKDEELRTIDGKEVVQQVDSQIGMVITSSNDMLHVYFSFKYPDWICLQFSM